MSRARKPLGRELARIARGLLSHKTQTIGLIIPDVANPFFAPVVRGAESAARKAGYRILLCNSEGDLRLEREYIDDLVSHRVEGLMLAPASDRSRSSILTLLRGSFPLVLIDRALPDVECDVIVSMSVARGGLSST
jgi:LacI family transcriptional regulator